MSAASAVTGGVAPILAARDLSVRFGPITALDRVDLDIRPGEIVALAGENGAGKSTLLRCMAGDIRPDTGQVTVDGQVLAPTPRAAARLGLAVVWQDLALCDNLDIASNVLLGREPRRLVFSETRFHSQVARLLDELGIDLPTTATTVSNLSGGQRQLVAVARAMRDRPRLLVLDEPTASLGVAESARVEQLAASLPAQGTTVLLVSHDVDQMFRLADRIVILRRGRVVAEVDPTESHPDEVSALLSGQPVDVSARRQLSRLHSLSDQLASAAPSSSLSLILSALSAALGIDQLCVHVDEGPVLRLAGSLGLPPGLAAAWREVPVGVGGGQIGRAAASGEPAMSADVRTATGWARYRIEARLAGIASSWSVPFTGSRGDGGVITMLSRQPGEPTRDDLDLAALYAGYAASALERDRLLGELTNRNMVLETIREVLQALAGPLPIEVGIGAALQTLQSGLEAGEIALVTRSAGEEEPGFRGWAGPRAGGPDGEGELLAIARSVLDGEEAYSGPVQIDPPLSGPDGPAVVAAFPAPGGQAALVARWSGPGGGSPLDRRTLLDDAANSLRLALEREESERAQRETLALRSSQDLQRKFLSWLSHELRTPLTAIRGYASSLMQPDVDWDGTSQRRFLERISDESARLGRLVDDLLDFSAIDSGILRLQPDWCDVALVLEAARACLPAGAADRVRIGCDPALPVVWADHDRLEQIFVNLFDNAIRHNPDGTSVTAEAVAAPEGFVTITVDDDGVGVPAELTSGRPGTRPERRSRTSGAGLGLSIARGIVDAHGGRIEIQPRFPGTACRVTLPVALGAPADGPEIEKAAR